MTDYSDSIFSSIKDIRKKNNDNGTKYWSNEINLTKSNEYIVNNNKNRLHCRSYWPNNNAKCIVIFCHGYASHCNRPIHTYISNEMNNNEIAYITIDVTGHGYSDGIKGYLDNYNDTIDDILTLLIHLYSTSSTLNDHYLQQKGKQLPLFIIGHSMGGAISINVASILSNPNDYYNTSNTTYSRQNSAALQCISPLFKGLMLLAPAIKMTLPPVIRFTLDYVLSTLMPLMSVPGGADNKDVNPKDCWDNDDYYQYIVNDGFPNNPNGLSFGPRIRTR